MENRLAFVISVVLFFTLLGGRLVLAGTIPAEGSAFPDITLPAPDKTGEKGYLGLTGKGSFRLSQIKADVIIVEIFSMYCPYCQKEAPNVNELYNLIDKRTALKDKMKIIGLGAGNTPFEVNVFRDRYDIRFPLFPDESFSIHQAVGEVRTPYFFVLKMAPGGLNKIVYSRVGSIHDPGSFLDMVIKKAGLR
jgi:peroxiredoxin